MCAWGSVCGSEPEMTGTYWTGVRSDVFGKEPFPLELVSGMGIDTFLVTDLGGPWPLRSLSLALDWKLTR